VVGNVATANYFGIQVSGPVTVTSNASYANEAGGFNVGSPFSGVITKNNMFANGTGAANCGLDNTEINLVAKNNYWGAASGPGAPPADSVCGTTAIVTPFATKPFTVKPLKP
jgi:hypothetical protein